MHKQVVQFKRYKLKKTWNKKIKIIAGRLVLFFIALAVVIWLGTQLFYFCVFHAIRTIPAELGELRESTVAKAVLLMNERVVRAPGTGKLLPVVAEGDRVPVGTLVAQLELMADPAGSSGKIQIKSPSTGIISYQLDGWESMYDRYSWQRVDPSVIFEKLEEGNNIVSGVREDIKQGEPVFKVIDNLANPFLIVQFPQGFKPHIEQNDQLTLTWDKEGTGKALVIAHHKKGDHYYAVVELKQARPFPSQRKLDLQLMHILGEGIIIPESALVEQEGQTGVYIMSVTGPKYRKVEVTATLNEEAAIQGIVPGVEVVTNPRLAEIICNK
ncbi:MAG TPA: hypothetical protein GXX21_06105 [Syntrophomonadaceae bacterium]|nr:hypothetical protein [Syntrophomonadaceae bacterium]